MATETGARAGRAAPQHIHPDQVALSTVMAALADPVRLSILRELAEMPDWTITCGSFNVPVGKAARSHHFTVLREAGLIEQRDVGAHRINRLRRPEFEAAFPGLLGLVTRSAGAPTGSPVEPEPSPSPGQSSDSES